MPLDRLYWLILKPSIFTPKAKSNKPRRRICWCRFWAGVWNCHILNQVVESQLFTSLSNRYHQWLYVFELKQMSAFFQLLIPESETRFAFVTQFGTPVIDHLDMFSIHYCIKPTPLYQFFFFFFLSIGLPYRRMPQQSRQQQQDERCRRANGSESRITNGLNYWQPLTTNGSFASFPLLCACCSSMINSSLSILTADSKDVILGIKRVISIDWLVPIHLQYLLKSQSD